MKRSTTHLPKRTQHELSVLAGLIRRYVPACSLILLYGNYARGKYVLWDEKVEFGQRTIYQSDYDVLVAIPKGNTRKTEDILRGIVTEKYHEEFRGRRYATPQFITETVATIAAGVENQQFFFTDIVREGIALFDDGKHALPKPGEPDYRQVQQTARLGFDALYPEAMQLLDRINTQLLPREDYRNCAFLLYRICEKLYSAFLLVFTNYRPESPQLRELAGMTKRFSREVATTFPQNTDFEKQSYDLLLRACYEDPLNRIGRVTREQAGYMLGGTERLGEAVRRLCLGKIDSYAELAAGHPTENDQIAASSTHATGSVATVTTPGQTL